MAPKKLGIRQIKLTREELKEAAFEASQGCMHLAETTEVNGRDCEAGILEMVRALKELGQAELGKKRRR